MDRRLDYASALWTRKAIRLSKTAELVRPVSSRLLWTSSLKSGGADRDRTDDLRLAKPALSQLSYSPPWKSWWAWEDLNFRPPAYQADALTN